MSPIPQDAAVDQVAPWDRAAPTDRVAPTDRIAPTASPTATVTAPNLTVCPPGRGYCDGRCADLRNDPDHCGACGASCRDGTCARGVCVCDRGGWFCDGRCVLHPLDCPCNADGEGRPCCDGWTRCGVRCARLEFDRENCGACGNRCFGLCIWGRCQ
ncbi:MAG: hypothetical protein U0325_29495 [Polyangiales bacterium]